MGSTISWTIRIFYFSRIWFWCWKMWECSSHLGHPSIERGFSDSGAGAARHRTRDAVENAVFCWAAHDEYQARWKSRPVDLGFFEAKTYQLKPATERKELKWNIFSGFKKQHFLRKVFCVRSRNSHWPTLFPEQAMHPGHERDWKRDEAWYLSLKDLLTWPLGHEEDKRFLITYKQRICDWIGLLLICSKSSANGRDFWNLEVSIFWSWVDALFQLGATASERYRPENGDNNLFLPKSHKALHFLVIENEKLNKGSPWRRRWLPRMFCVHGT